MVSLTTTLFCLAMTVYHESRGEPILAQQTVAHIVLNRADNQDKEVCDVIKEPYQFSWVKNGKGPKIKEYEAWVNSLVIAQEAIERTKDKTGGANHFWKAGYNPSWSDRCVWKKRIKNTVYCKIPMKSLS